MNGAESKPRRHWSMIVVAILMMLFGVAEVATGFTHEFFGITTTAATISTISAAAIGSCYIVAGFLVITMKRWAAMLAIVFVAAEIAGRGALVAVGFYPLDSVENIAGIVAGTAIAVAFAAFIWWKRGLFSR